MQPPTYRLRGVTPWMISGASSVYAIRRARHLSLAEATSGPLIHFLARQSDVILLMLGSQIVWYLTTRRPPGFRAEQSAQRSLSPDEALHQLRQVLTALSLGTGLLARRLAKGKTADLAPLVARLQKIVRDGTQALNALDNTRVTSLLHERAMGGWQLDDNGTEHQRRSFPSA